MILPIFAAISRAFEIVLDKTILSKQKVDYKTYLVVGFFVVLIIGTTVGAILGKVEAAFFHWTYLLAFLGIVATAVGWNSIFYRAIQHEKLTNVEPIILTTPIIVFLISAIFMPEERKWEYIILGIIAAVSVIFARFKKRNLNFNQYSLSIVAYTFLVGFEALFIKVVLENCNVFALYPIRVFFVMIIIMIIFKPNLKKIKKLSKKNWISFLGVALIANTYHFFLYLSYDYYGIAVTTLFMVLEPIIVYFASLFFFKEKFQWRSVIAAAIVVACVIYAQFL